MNEINCPICNKPLSSGELNLNHEWHTECQICQICQKPLDRDLFEKALRSGKQIAHLPCTKAASLDRLRNKILPLVRETVDAANDEILNYKNTFDGRISDVELLSGLLQQLKEFSYNVNWMLSLQRDKIQIKSNQEYSEKLKDQKKAKAEQKAAVEIQKAEREAKAEMFAQERANPELRNRRKAIEALLSIGWTQADAEKHVEEQFRAKGKIN